MVEEEKKSPNQMLCCNSGTPGGRMRENKLCDMLLNMLPEGGQALVTGTLSKPVQSSVGEMLGY